MTSKFNATTSKVNENQSVRSEQLGQTSFTQSKSFSLKNKLIELDRNVELIYDRVDTNKRSINNLIKDTHDSNEFLKAEFRRDKNELEDSLQKLMNFTENEFLSQENINHKIDKDISLMKNNQTECNNRILSLAKKLKFLESHVGSEELK